MKAPVIYKIVNVTNQKFYVGSTMDTRERFRTHRNKLRGNRHHCKHLQAAWNKYGEECFRFAVVEEVASAAALQAAEDVWLQEWVGKEQCYNSGLRSDAPWRGASGVQTPNFGVSVSAEQKQRISETLKATYAANPGSHPRLGKKHTPEALAKIAANRTPPAGDKHYRFGKELSAEVRAKIGAAQRGVKKGPRTFTPEGMAKIRAAAAAGHYASFAGKTHTDDAKEKMSRAVVAVLPDRSQRRFTGLSVMRDMLGVSIASVIRACTSGKPVRQGVCAGWVLSYEDAQTNVAPVIPEEFLAYPRTRAAAKAAGAAHYFTGLPCEHGHIALRKVKGTCVECAKIDVQKSNAARTAKKQRTVV